MTPKKAPQFIRVEQRDAALIWTFDRPDRSNAIGPAIANELDRLLKDLEKQLKGWFGAKTRPKTALSPRMLVLAANAQTRHLSATWIAGGDLKELAALTPQAGQKYSQSMLDICQRLEQLPIPVLAAIDGAAIGGGAELALAADLRIGTPEATFDFKQLKVGLATGFGGTRRLVGLVGKAQAQHLLLKTESIDAHRSVAAGLLHELVDEGRGIDQRIASLTKHFVELDPHAVAAQKHMLAQASGANTDAVDKKEQLKFKNLWGKHAHHAFLQRFLEKSKN